MTASLSDGYVFANGGTTFTDVTGSNGPSRCLISLYRPRAEPRQCRQRHPERTRRLRRWVGRAVDARVREERHPPEFQRHPSGSKPVGGSLYVSPSGDLLDAADGGRVLSRDVAVCGEIASTSGAWSIPVLKADGLACGSSMGTNGERSTSRTDHLRAPVLPSSHPTGAKSAATMAPCGSPESKATGRTLVGRNPRWLSPCKTDRSSTSRATRSRQRWASRQDQRLPAAASSSARPGCSSMALMGQPSPRTSLRTASCPSTTRRGCSRPARRPRCRRRPARVRGLRRRSAERVDPYRRWCLPRLGRTIDRRTQRGGCSGNRSEHARRVRCASGLVAHSPRGRCDISIDDNEWDYPGGERDALGLDTRGRNSLPDPRWRSCGCGEQLVRCLVEHRGVRTVCGRPTELGRART